MPIVQAPGGTSFSPLSRWSVFPLPYLLGSLEVCQSVMLSVEEDPCDMVGVKVLSKAFICLDKLQPSEVA